jgi:hypothetical protein
VRVYLKKTFKILVPPHCKRNVRFSVLVSLCRDSVVVIVSIRRVIWVRRSEPPSRNVVIVVVFSALPPLTPLLLLVVLAKLSFWNSWSNEVIGTPDELDLKVVVLVIVIGLVRMMGLVSSVWAPPNVRVSYLLKRDRLAINRISSI